MEDGAKPINQMVSFILHEARQKASELQRKGEEEFNITKMQIVKEQREKVRKEYTMKAKKLETQRAIARSTAINAARLQNQVARTAAFDETVEEVRKQLHRVTTDQNAYRKLLCNLITQGALKLLEEKVTVRCRAEDKVHVQAVLSSAETLYAERIKAQAGVKRSVTLTVDTKVLPSTGKNAVLGGVVLTCHNSLISVDNTLDARVRLTEDQDKPTIRAILFPVK